MSFIDGLKLFPHLIATKDGIDAATAASTTLDFVNEATLETHVPFDIVMEWASGTFDACTLDLKGNGITIGTTLTLIGLDSSKVAFGIRSSFIANSGDLSVTIVTPNSGASTFNIKVFGVSL